MSGPGASLPIVDALQAVVTRPGVEVVILARGGGDAPVAVAVEQRRGLPGGGRLPGPGGFRHRP